MWAYSFMQNALMAGMITATICGLVSVFVLKNSDSIPTQRIFYTGDPV